MHLFLKFLIALVGTLIAHECAAVTWTLDAEGVLIDSSQMLRIENVRAEHSVKDSWRPVSNTIFSDGVAWMKVAFSVPRDEVGTTLVFSLRESFPTETSFFVYNSDGILVSQSQLGSSVPFANWPRWQMGASHEFKINRPGVHTIYVRLRSYGLLSLRYSLNDSATHQMVEQQNVLVFGLTFGGLAGFFLYNLILWRTMKRTVFLKFSGLIAGYLLASMLNSGIISPMIAWFNPRLAFIEYMIPGLMSGMMVLFCQTYLKRYRFGRGGQWLHAIGMLLLGASVLSAFAPVWASVILVIACPVAYSIILVMALLEATRLQRHGLLLTIGTAPVILLFLMANPFLSGAFQVSLREALPIAYLVQILAVGVGLSNGVAELRQKFISALSTRVDAMEKLVDQRTSELQRVNQTLKVEIETRRCAEEEARLQTKMVQDAQVQLLSASRMSALGEMAAGLSHEINNPLTILKGHLYLMGHAVREGGSQTAKIDELTCKSIVAIDRIVKVVKGLREFSLQEDMEHPAAVNLKKSCDIIVDLLGERLANSGINWQIQPIPEELSIWGRPADLTQTLLSLVNFCIGALHQAERKSIDLTFRMSNAHVVIRIEYTAKISNELAEHIFTPFFLEFHETHVQLLGISIAKQLVNSVGGDIRLDRGASATAFEITLRRTSGGALPQNVLGAIA